MLADSNSSFGIAPDTRQGIPLRTSATTGAARTLEQAMTVALTTLVRQADLQYADLDVMTVSTQTLVRRHPGGSVLMVVASGMAYTRMYFEG
jgi:hypothetical protein